MNDNSVQGISVNPSKRAKNVNINFSPIIHPCMDIRKGRAKLKNFRSLLDSGCRSSIVMKRLVGKLGAKKMM